MYLLREVERFLNRTKLAPTRFGREALNDPRFVHDLRKGSEPRPKTEARVRKFMEDYQ
jgi:2,4-dienoyl-CoA reductase-like NADH-dependent reductase (Old Yellow Enzyme family)